MGPLEKLPGFDAETTTRRNVLVAGGYVYAGAFVVAVATGPSEDDHDGSSNGEDDGEGGDDPRTDDGDGAPSEFVPAEDVDTVEAWVDDAISTIEHARRTIVDWDDDPDDYDVSTFEEMAADAEAVRDDFSDDVEPLMDGIAETDFDRTVGGDTWTVRGQDLHDALEELWWAVDAVVIAAEQIADADADPAEMDDRTWMIVDDVLVDGEAAVDDARRLLFEGGT